MTDRRALLLIFALALSARWVYRVSVAPRAQLEAVDARGYHQLALNLLAGHGYSLNAAPPYVPDGLRPPGYPLFVAGIYALAGPDPAVVALVQGLLDSATAVVVAASLGCATAQRWPARLGGLLYALNPTAWRYCNAVLTEIVLAGLLALVVWAFVRFERQGRLRWLAAGGLLAGLSVLVKPNLVLLPLILAGAALLLPRTTPSRGWLAAVRGAVLPLAAAGLVVSPWLVRNDLVFDRWLLSHAFEDNLAHVSAVATLAQVRGERVAPWTPRWEALYAELWQDAVRRYGLAFPPTPATPAEADARHRQLASVAASVIRAHPLAFAFAHTEGFLRSWVPQEHRFWYSVLAGRTWESLGTPEGVLGQALDLARREGWAAALRFAWRARVTALPPLARALWAGWLLAYTLSAALLAAGTWRWRARPALLWLLWATILFTTFLPGPIAYVRFRVPVAPLLIVLMAAAAGRSVVSQPAARHGFTT